MQAEKKKTSLASVIDAITKDGQKKFRSRVRDAARETSATRDDDENRTVRFAEEDESFVGLPALAHSTRLATEPSMLPPLPGLTDAIAARIAEIRELQATYAVPTGPPPAPPTETARRYSGVNPKMAEDEYYVERFRGREGRGREQRAR